MLERLADCAVGLAEGAVGRLRELGERAREGVDEEGVRLGAEREGARLAAGADDPARGRRERAEVLALATRGARRELGREAGGQQQLEPERERLCAHRGAWRGVQ